MERPLSVPRALDAAPRRPYRSPEDGPRISVRPRKTLPHEFPSFVDRGKEIFFITVCRQKRGVNQLAGHEVGPPLIETFQHRNEKDVWWAHLAMIMPDHVHFLLSFPRENRIQVVMSKWKEWTAKSLGIDWQRDFFEHRLRRGESYREKADYILFNPVRAGLVSKTEDWPYVFLAGPQR